MIGRTTIIDCVTTLAQMGPADPSGPTSAIDSTKLVVAIMTATTTWNRITLTPLRNTPRAVLKELTIAQSVSATSRPVDGVAVWGDQTRSTGRAPTSITRETAALTPRLPSNDRRRVDRIHR